MWGGEAKTLTNVTHQAVASHTSFGPPKLFKAALVLILHHATLRNNSPMCGTGPNQRIRPYDTLLDEWLPLDTSPTPRLSATDCYHTSGYCSSLVLASLLALLSFRCVLLKFPCVPLL